MQEDKIWYLFSALLLTSASHLINHLLQERKQTTFYMTHFKVSILHGLLSLRLTFGINESNAA
jgi:hypothetical protein